MQERKYSPFAKKDIAILKRNGCSAEDWTQVFVYEGFDPQRVVSVTFKGKVEIGRLDSKVEMIAGIKRNAGIFRANLHNVRIGDNCVISNVNGWLSNLDIEEGVVIENVGTIACTDETTFGNGHEISVLNEAGGRELKITNETSAQIAYLTVLYRERKDLITALNRIADRFSNEIKSNRAFIGRHARIINCNEIINVHIGAYSMINGVLSLKKGTINSSEEAPAIVGHGVVAENFIFQKGSSVEDGALVVSSLVGEGTRIGKQFSAESSVFFANSEGFHSEVCSVFAGPYSVTHHRSTLLIAALLSFYNAGSGTNQSNHMYKLGPVHQGILERGCKTGSFSYLLWPSRVGAFTAIMGKHYANFDTADFPFSYIDEENGKSTLVPGMNFFTVGTYRDGEKWPSRDRRKFSNKLDLIIFDVLTPFTAQKMINGQKILMELYESSQKGDEYVTYKGIHIKRLLLKTCSRYYKLALDKYFGDILVRRIEEESPARNATHSIAGGPARIRDVLKHDGKSAVGSGEWVDVCGLICCKSRIDSLISEVVSGKVNTFEKLHKRFRQIYDSYKADEWNWFLETYPLTLPSPQRGEDACPPKPRRRREGEGEIQFPKGSSYKELKNRELSDETNENLHEFLDQWKKSSLKLLNMVMNDAQKEFEGAVRTGFGIDGNKDSDFEAVRGTFEENKFMKKLREEMEEINRRYEDVCKLVK